MIGSDLQRNFSAPALRTLRLGVELNHRNCQRGAAKNAEDAPRSRRIRQSIVGLAQDRTLVRPVWLVLVCHS
jgi:hypothetical protein